MTKNGLIIRIIYTGLGIIIGIGIVVALVG